MNTYIAFCKVVELGSFSKAADVLGYSQSGVSQMIQSLEDELSIRLLVRCRSGVKLTPEGEELLPYITTVVNSHRAMIEKNAEIKGLSSGLIRIGTYTSISSSWLPQLIKEFQSLYPQVKFKLIQGEYTEIREWVRIGEIDFGFHLQSATMLKGMKMIPLYTDKMMAVLPLHHPLAGKESVTLKELSTEPYLLLGEGHEPLEAFHAQQLEPQIKSNIYDDYTVLAMLEAGYEGISIMPEFILQNDRYKVAKVPIDPPVKREIGIIFKDLKTMPIASKQFIKHIREQFKE